MLVWENINGNYQGGTIIPGYGPPATVDFSGIANGILGVGTASATVMPSGAWYYKLSHRANELTNGSPLVFRLPNTYPLSTSSGNPTITGFVIDIASGVDYDYTSAYWKTAQNGVLNADHIDRPHVQRIFETTVIVVQGNSGGWDLWFTGIDRASYSIDKTANATTVYKLMFTWDTGWFVTSQQTIKRPYIVSGDSVVGAGFSSRLPIRVYNKSSISTPDATKVSNAAEQMNVLSTSHVQMCNAHNLIVYATTVGSFNDAETPTAWNWVPGLGHSPASLAGGVCAQVRREIWVGSTLLSLSELLQARSQAKVYQAANSALTQANTNATVVHEFAHYIDAWYTTSTNGLQPFAIPQTSVANLTSSSTSWPRLSDSPWFQNFYATYFRATGRNDGSIPQAPPPGQYAASARVECWAETFTAYLLDRYFNDGTDASLKNVIGYDSVGLQGVTEFKNKMTAWNMMTGWDGFYGAT
jgi:hypothetical protein